MTRTIQLTIDYPWPAQRSGGDIRNAFIAKSASALGPVHVVSLEAVGASSIEPNITHGFVPSFAGTLPRERLDRRKRTMIRLSAADLEFLENEIAAFGPDLAICEGVGVCAALPVLQRLRIPTVLDMHNVESVLYRSIKRESSTKKLLKDRFFGSFRWGAAHRFDRDSSLQVNETWVTSNLDRHELMKLGGADSVVVNNPIPDNSLSSLPISAQRYRSKDALFVGLLSYAPNIVAVTEAAQKIWPLVRKADADARLLICGRAPSPAVSSLDGKDGVTILEGPKDLSRVYGVHGYSLMPIRIGGGTRLKVLEAMVAGTVIVATKKAVEGLGLQAGTHYLQAECPVEFQMQIDAAVANSEKIAVIAQTAREFALANFGSRPLAEHIRSRIKKVSRCD